MKLRESKIDGVIVDSDNMDDTGDPNNEKSRSQFAMYLSEKLQDELNNRFKRFNACRTLGDKQPVQKHRHYLEGVVRAGLNRDNLETYILERTDFDGTDSHSREHSIGQDGEIPHRVRYDSPKKNREGESLVVAEGDRERLNKLEMLASKEFNEVVWILDVKLAALRGGLRSNEAFLKEMEKIGYGYFD